MLVYEDAKDIRMYLKTMALGGLLTVAGCSLTGTAGSGSAVQAFAQPAGAERPVAAAIVDAMAGGIIGGTLGSNLDSRDRRRAVEAEYRALEYAQAGQAVAWGTRGSRSGEVVAGAPYRVGSQDCRQYVHTLHRGGQSQSARGTACRNGDGSWTPLT